jgi:hypothetical protein
LTVIVAWSVTPRIVSRCAVFTPRTIKVRVVVN